MWNIYLKATNKKKWYTQNSIWRFSKVRLYISFWEAPTQEDITEFSKLFLFLWKSHTQLREMNHLLQHLQGLGIKIKTVISWSSRKGGFFVKFILSKGNFFNIWIWSQCIVHWINPQNIYTFTLKKKKKYFIHFFRLFLKTSKAFSVSLSVLNMTVFLSFPLDKRCKLISVNIKTGRCFKHLFQHSSDYVSLCLQWLY